MATRNTRLWRAFDDGHAVACLLGDGDWLIRDYTWGDHDALLVVGQLVDWAEARDKAADAGSALREAVSRAAVRDVAEAYQIVWTVIVIEDDGGQPVPVTGRDLAALLPPIPATAGPETRGIAKRLQDRGLLGR